MIEISKTNEDKFVQTIRILQGMLDEADLPEYEALKTAIKSLEAWELVKKELIAKKNFNAEVKDAFEVGSHSRIECNTTVAVLGEVLNLIDKHLAEVEDDKT